MNHEQLDHDYRSSMQRAAFAFLQRHEAQHLVDSDVLYENCVRHMTTALEVPVFMAQRLVHNAWSELQVISQGKRAAFGAGVSPGRAVVHLMDVRADLGWPVEARSATHALIEPSNPQHKQHLR
jgi:hypothetical protein